jgi:hypothetical protein
LIAILFTLALFSFWCLLGLALLAVARADMSSLRVVLTAPALGMSVGVLSLFVFSHAGIALRDCARPIALVTGLAAISALAVKRPRLPAAALPVLAICVASLFLSAWPMLHYGFDWLANANNDMATYVLSATQALYRGLLAAPDLAGLSQDRNYASLLGRVHAIGTRPGGEIQLAGLAGITERPAYELFMPYIFALNLCLICGTAALALQATRRTFAAVFAAILVAVSPLAAFGVLQQLLGQVGGLALAVAVLALLLRADLHRGRRPRLGELLPISVLAAAVLIVYVELAAVIALAYGLYLALLALRRELDTRVAMWLWVVPLAFAAIVLNSYLISELHFLASQTNAGVGGDIGKNAGDPPTFGFSLIPSALPGILGIQPMPVAGNARYLGASIAVAVLVIAGLSWMCVASALRGVAAAVMLVTFGVLAVSLAVTASDFGLYKLYMYVQPFLAALVAVWVARVRKRASVAIVFGGLALLIVAQLRTHQEYVRASRDPGALRHASARSVLPAFERVAARSREPLISVTENTILGELQAAAAARQRLMFISQNVLRGFMTPQIARLLGWRERAFRLTGSDGVDRFSESTHASTALAQGRCTLVLPTGTQTVLNRRSLPEGSDDFVATPCKAIGKNTLVFVSSGFGHGSYVFPERKTVAFYGLEPDIFNSGHTMSAFGRRALFRILNSSAGTRLEINFTKTYVPGSRALPNAAIIGERSVRLPLVGRGSARVFSQPLRPQIIAGHPYIVLDMGERAKTIKDKRRGLQKLWGGDVPVDPRYVTAFVRNISLVSEGRYRQLKRPLAIADFPRGLANPNLEYSGISEDGWIAEDAYAVFAGGPPRRLVVRGLVPGPGHQRLRISVNGRQIAARSVEPGKLEVVLPLAASKAPRRVELQWDVARPLPSPDGRPVSALLHFLGLVEST